MQAVSEIVSPIPVWVWVVLAFGIWMGVKALRERRVSLTMATLLPLVFLFLSLSSLAGVVGGAPAIGLLWLLAVATGIVLGWFFLSSEPIEVYRGKGALLVPGSWVVLVLFLVIFTTRFSYGFEQAAHPEAVTLTFQVVVFALSGLSTGIATGRTAKLYNRYFQVPA